MHSIDELLLHYCCTLAWQHQSLALPNPSVGAIVVAPNGQILSSGVHIIAGSPHAEVIALQNAYYILSGDKQILQCESAQSIHKYLLNHHQGIFKGCSLYVSLEPCNHQGKTPPCAALVAAMGFAKVCIAISESHAKAVGGLRHLLENKINAISIQSLYVERIAQNLLLPFDILRKQKRFILYKLVQRLDGSYKSGHISSKGAQIFTHNQRSVCDYICISGATLRHDNPQLNSRYAVPPYDSAVTPEVIVLSRTLSNSMMVNHALANRMRLYTNPADINELQGFIIVEGGWNLLSAMRESVDMLLIHKAPKCIVGEEIGHTFSGEFKLLHQSSIEDDVLLWLA